MEQTHIEGIELPRIKALLPRLVENISLTKPIECGPQEMEIIAPNFYQKHFLGYLPSEKRKEGVYYFQITKPTWFTRIWEKILNVWYFWKHKQRRIS